MATDPDSRRRASESQVEQGRRAAHDARAQLAWIEGYLHGVGRPNAARALARKRSMEKIRHRRAALEVARALRNK